VIESVADTIDGSVKAKRDGFPDRAFGSVLDLEERLREGRWGKGRQDRRDKR
jgi:hypothetical protein